MIKFTTVNCNGVKIERSFDSIADIIKDWWNEEGTTLPDSEDPVVCYNIDDKDIYPKNLDFDGFICDLQIRYWNNYKS